jgi:hypothetical protein
MQDIPPAVLRRTGSITLLQGIRFSRQTVMAFCDHLCKSTTNLRPTALSYRHFKIPQPFRLPINLLIQSAPLTRCLLLPPCAPLRRSRWRTPLSRLAVRESGASCWETGAAGELAHLPRSTRWHSCHGRLSKEEQWAKQQYIAHQEENALVEISAAHGEDWKPSTRSIAASHSHDHCSLAQLNFLGASGC